MPSAPHPKFVAARPFRLGTRSYAVGDAVPPGVATRPHVAPFVTTASPSTKRGSAALEPDPTTDPGKSSGDDDKEK